MMYYMKLYFVPSEFQTCLIVNQRCEEVFLHSFLCTSSGGLLGCCCCFFVEAYVLSGQSVFTCLSVTVNLRMF